MKPPPASARWAVFGFGVVAYLVGLGALAALALVMRGLGPFDRAFAQAGGKLTGGVSGTPDLALALLVDVGLLAGFGLQHSVMARSLRGRLGSRVGTEDDSGHA